MALAMLALDLPRSGLVQPVHRVDRLPLILFVTTGSLPATQGQRWTDRGVGRLYQSAAKPLQLLEEVTPMSRQFDVVVEKDSEGFFVASVPALPGYHTQIKSLDQLVERIKEAIELCLEVPGTYPESLDFVGVQRVTVEVCRDILRFQERHSSQH